MTSSRGLTYIPALDGLRGVAIVAVVAFHGSLLTGGFLGVDLFFTLSGFLITSLLLTEVGTTGSVSLRRFWSRRARRLLPAILLLLALVPVFAAFFALPFQRATLRGDALSTLFYVANWHQLDTAADYWSRYTGPSPLQHTWSLAIEEQFYLVFPLVFVGLARLALGASAGNGGRRTGAGRVLTTYTTPESRRRAVGSRVMVVAGVLMVGSVWLMVGATPTDSVGLSALYFGTPTRLASILVGVILACALDRHPSIPASAGRALDGAAVLAMGLLLVAWIRVTGTDSFVYSGGLFVGACAAAVIIADISRRPRSAASIVLSIAPLRWLGRVSYGLYLWHWPVFVTLTTERTGLDGALLLIARLTVTFALVVPSYLLVENPIRTGRMLSSWRAPVVGTTAIATVLVLLLVAMDTRPPDVRPYLHLVPLPSQLASTLDPGERPRVMIVGDSVPDSIAVSLVPNSAPLGVDLRSSARPACGVAVDETRVKMSNGSILTDGGGCRELIESWGQTVDGWRPHAALLMVSAPGYTERELDGTFREVCDEFNRAFFRSELRTAVLRLHSAVATVVVASIPQRGAGPRFGSAADIVDCMNQDIRQVAAETPWLHVIDFAGYLCPGGVCRSSIDGFPLRPDGIHFWGESGAIVGGWLIDQTIAAAGADRG